MLGIIGKTHLIKIMMMLIIIYLYMAGILKQIICKHIETRNKNNNNNNNK